VASGFERIGSRILRDVLIITPSSTRLIEAHELSLIFKR
jgi:hypothetical protein